MSGRWLVPIDTRALPGAGMSPESLSAGATVLREAALELDEAGPEVATRWQSLFGVYEAPESEALRATLAPTSARISEAADAARQVSAALEENATDLATIRTRMSSLAGPITSFNAALRTTDGMADAALARTGAELHAQVRAADDLLTMAEVSCARAIQRATAALSPSGLTSVSAPGVTTGGSLPAGWSTGTDSSGNNPAFPPRDLDAAATLAWWSSLTSAEQRTLITAYGERIGNLDGIPAAVRDEANRAALARDMLLAQEEAEYYSLVVRGAPIPQWLIARGWSADPNVAGIVALSRIMRAVSRTALLKSYHSTSSLADRRLLIYQPDSVPPRAAVAVGDVDTAEHVAVVVPGTGTTVGGQGLSNMDAEAASLREVIIEEHEVAPTGVAIVSWIGYTPPMSILPEAAVQGFADYGAPHLASFARGLVTTHAGGDLHLTVAAHSYGAALAGRVSSDAANGIDDVIVYGAPGVGVNPVPGVGRYSMLNDDDPIKLTHLVEAHGPVPYDHPVVEANPSGIGVQIMTEAAEGWTQIPTGASVTPDGLALKGTSEHDYMVSGTRAEYNFAAVIAGQPDRALWDVP